MMAVLGRCSGQSKIRDSSNNAVMGMLVVFDNAVARRQLVLKGYLFLKFRCCSRCSSDLEP